MSSEKKNTWSGYDYDMSLTITFDNDFKKALQIRKTEDNAVKLNNQAVIGTAVCPKTIQ